MTSGCFFFHQFPPLCPAYLLDTLICKNKVPFRPGQAVSLIHFLHFSLMGVSANSLSSRGRPVRQLFHVLASLLVLQMHVSPPWLRRSAASTAIYVRFMNSVTTFLSEVLPCKPVWFSPLYLFSPWTSKHFWLPIPLYPSCLLSASSLDCTRYPTDIMICEESRKLFVQGAVSFSQTPTVGRGSTWEYLYPGSQCFTLLVPGPGMPSIDTIISVLNTSK